MYSQTTALARRLRPEIRNILLVWIVLVAITILAWCLTPENRGDGSTLDSMLVSVIVVLGMIKSRLIIRHFMEVRAAPRWLRIGTDAWVVVLWLALLGLNLYR
ncbi:cytochrome C oxidase subunit IV family protein [Nocardia miyunensis]|uniref:cytochrome C oxidase subunit IV family protein n=1 Tax=Nocardia miyunensis TaxID=282684 RepID=UPI000A4945D1|nr:cytochrome C oxidase subunit IV family protein [Nocardia miyunensis]